MGRRFLHPPTLSLFHRDQETVWGLKGWQSQPLQVSARLYRKEWRAQVGLFCSQRRLNTGTEGQKTCLDWPRESYAFCRFTILLWRNGVGAPVNGELTGMCPLYHHHSAHLFLLAVSSLMAALVTRCAKPATCTALGWCAGAFASVCALLLPSPHFSTPQPSGTLIFYVGCDVVFCGFRLLVHWFSQCFCCVSTEQTVT